MNPMQRVDQCFNDIVAHYEEGERREQRAAAKLLLVALEQFRASGDPNWYALVKEYLDLAAFNGDKFDAILASQRAGANHRH